MAEKLKAVLESGKEKIEVGSGCEWGMLDYSGFEASDYSIALSNNAQLDGSVVAGKKVEPRPISITAEYCKTDKDDRERKRLIRLFNPKKSGVLTVSVGDVSRKIAYEVESFEIGEKSLFKPLRFTVNLLCPSPYWQGVEEFAKNMAGIRKLLAFPFVIAKSRNVLSYREMQQEAVITNKGDKTVGLNVVFEAKRGNVMNPALYNLTTGVFLRMELEMAEGDVLTICTVPGKKRVELNGVNAIQYIDRKSRFFGIEPGETLLKYDAEEGKQNLDVYPKYTPEYLGV